jgi:hypothetical protein
MNYFIIFKKNKSTQSSSCGCEANAVRTQAIWTILYALSKCNVASKYILIMLQSIAADLADQN